MTFAVSGLAKAEGTPLCAPSELAGLVSHVVTTQRRMRTAEHWLLSLYVTEVGLFTAARGPALPMNHVHHFNVGVLLAKLWALTRLAKGRAKSATGKLAGRVHNVNHADNGMKTAVGSPTAHSSVTGLLDATN